MTAAEDGWDQGRGRGYAPGRGAASRVKRMADEEQLAILKWGATSTPGGPGLMACSRKTGVPLGCIAPAIAAWPRPICSMTAAAINLERLADRHSPQPCPSAADRQT